VICRHRRIAKLFLLASVGVLAVVTRPAPAAPATATATATATAASPTPDYTATGLYNLANSYARAGKPGLAVLNYERARLLAPGDPDLEANERHVRESVRLPSPLPSTVERFIARVPPSIVAWIGVLGLALGGTALVAGTAFTRRNALHGDAPRHTGRGRLRAACLTLGCAAVVLPLCQGALLWPTLREGVVVTGTAPVLVSPVPMGDPLFSLTEAETVKITAQHEGYVLIVTRNGRSGWVALTNLVPVLPRR